jgi:hypothetical protein
LNRGLGAALLLIAALAGCGGGAPDRSSQQGPAGFGQPLNLASCVDWNKAELNQRVQVVRELRKFAGGPAGSPPVHGRVLDDDRAYRILDGFCSKDYAKQFRLYRLYTRAAAFAHR